MREYNGVGDYWDSIGDCVGKCVCIGEFCIGGICMGFGHHRIAYAAGSWTTDPTDTQTRITRLSSNLNTKLRILIPVGGAGIQRKFIIQLVRALVQYCFLMSGSGNLGIVF